jgi:hypothetical protein
VPLVHNGMIQQHKQDHRMRIASIGVHIGKNTFHWPPSMLTARSLSRLIHRSGL